jgi:dipeptidyl aminopeptidase/acylaminoacyl peptidase
MNMDRVTPAAASVVASLLLAGYLAGGVAAASSGGPAAAGRALALDDLFTLRGVSDPQFSPDGEWVAFTVSRLDRKTDKNDSDIWMASWDGTRRLRMTSSAASEHTPRFSPDGRYLAFLSDRSYEKETDQLWLLHRAGGEAERVTELEGGVSGFAWSPDGRQVVLVVDDTKVKTPLAGEPDTPESAAGGIEKGDEKEKGEGKERPRPIVLDRLQFKQDTLGYLGKERSRIHLFDLATRKTVVLTPGPYDHDLPAWSPDGTSLAFVSKRGEDPDRHSNWDVFVMKARHGAGAAQLTRSAGSDSDPDYESGPAWSPDGASLAYLHGGAPEKMWYGIVQVAVIGAAGGEPGLPTKVLDRNTIRPRWSPDGRSLLFILEDDGESSLARVPAAGGAVERLTAAGEVVSDYAVGPEGRLAVLVSTPSAPAEVMALEQGSLRPLSRQNDELMREIRLGATETLRFTSADGTGIGGFVVKPPGYEAGRRYPAILRIHGGPVGQYDHSFQFDWQLFAAHGYLVVAANPRGSSGRGENFQMAIFANWGSVDVQDVLAAVDHVAERGMADSDRLGLGGWSYGGMLTNYTIARDTRFKAAVSGSSISNILAGYGTDHYIREYELELGRPWENLEAWLRNSYPFLHADRIVTPTLFLCGQNDVNVPLIASEQMYQALRSLGVDTQLVIYPGQYHGIKRPSFQRDRLQRYLDWYDRYLKTDHDSRP